MKLYDPEKMMQLVATYEDSLTQFVAKNSLSILGLPVNAGDLECWRIESIDARHALTEYLRGGEVDAR